MSGVINPANKNKRNFWVKGEYGKGADHWLETAESVPGSWWSHWDQWLKARGGKQIDAPADVGSDALKSTYESLKSYLANKYGTVDVDRRERDPDDDGRRTRLAAALREGKVDQEKAVVYQSMGNHVGQRSEKSDGDRSPLPFHSHWEAACDLPIGPEEPGSSQQSKETQPGGKVQHDVVRMVEIGLLPGSIKDVTAAIFV